MIKTAIPEESRDLVAPMRDAHQAILAALSAAHIPVPPYPTIDEPGDPRGTAAARAYPIQGVLKYHGMADWTWRTAYLPSVSVNNDAGETVTLVAFDPRLAQDEVTIGGLCAQGRERERVVRTLDFVRQLAHIDSHARVVSANRVRASRVGKGLGTSASASAALAAAALAAALGRERADNTRLLSTTGRLLAGSGCRSATGGLSLWLSYPGIDHEECCSVRLDQHDELADLRLVTVPIDSRIGLKTEQAHRDAPRSSFFAAWLASRQAEIVECIDAATSGDWQTIAALAELDSIRLHGVTMSGSRGNKLFAWEPENIALFRMCNRLRDEGVPVYFSTDTGPTTVFLTHRDHVETLVSAIDDLRLGLEAVSGGLGGPVEQLDPGAAENLLANGN